MVIFSFLTLAPATTLAAAEPAQPHSLSNYLFAKVMSENYVMMLKKMACDENGNEILATPNEKGNDKLYQAAKFSYQIAYNKFLVFSSMYAFLYDEKGQILEKDEAKLAVIGQNAYTAFLKFKIDAESAMRSLSDNQGYNSNDIIAYVNDEITMREMLKFTFANVFLSKSELQIDKTKISKIIDMAKSPNFAADADLVIELISNMYSKYYNLRNNKYTKLQLWLDKCNWNSWDSIKVTSAGKAGSNQGQSTTVQQNSQPKPESRVE